MSSIHFTDSQLRNIAETRERLYRYKLTYQPYPVDPPPVPDVVEHKTVYVENVTDGQFLQLRAQVQDLKNRVDTLYTKRKKQGKWD